ncbi:GNAT family N-acetyltransferase [Virgisporangium ochraceum]|uniref:N-acetyltransferase n=1 Tax=Virgisporangium ochraceum TaxID=65505 RepID=A0A8J4A5G6_9ACTN|nr:N-acetyltransferase [Virgisporangium ochraceum]
MWPVTELETPRLRLRRWRADDLDAMARINAHPDVLRWIGNGSGHGRSETAAEIERFELFWREHGFGRFAVDDRATGELLGFAGMSIPTDVPEIIPAVEIGWRFKRSSWGQGFATEAAGAALGFAATVGLERIVAVHVVGNDASARVMQKLGMRFELASVDTIYGLPVHVYAIDLKP